MHKMFRMLMQKVTDQILSLVCLQIVTSTDSNDVFPDNLQSGVGLFKSVVIG
jgi:hypothetical protein